MLKLTSVNASLSCICKFPSLITKDVPNTVVICKITNLMNINCIYSNTSWWCTFRWPESIHVLKLDYLETFMNLIKMKTCFGSHYRTIEPNVCVAQILVMTCLMHQRLLVRAQIVASKCASVGQNKKCRVQPMLNHLQNPSAPNLLPSLTQLLDSSRSQILWRLQIGCFCKTSWPRSKASWYLYLLWSKTQQFGAALYHGMTLFTSADKLVKSKQMQNTKDITLPWM